MIANLYLVKRGPRPSYHKAPYHPIIICTRRPIAEWESDWTGRGSWVWLKEADKSSGWLLVKWEGLNVDYGHIVRACMLPDGKTKAGIFHDRKEEPWSLMDGACWWSDHNMPEWIADKGVKYPNDEFTVRSVIRATNAEKGIGRERKLIEAVEKNINKRGNWIAEWAAAAPITGAAP